MLTPIPDMPAGTLGFTASGRLTRDEYHDQLMAPIREVIERGDTLNFLFATDPDFAGLDLGALYEDVKAAGTIGLRRHSAFGRFAIVTDKDWLRHGVSAFGWLSPGELKIFEPAELDQAKAWVGAGS